MKGSGHSDTMKSGAMVQTDQRVRLLQRMFTELEWNNLWQNGTFKFALETAGDTLQDIEKLAFLGDQLIHAAFPSAIKRTYLEGLRSGLN